MRFVWLFLLLFVLLFGKMSFAQESIPPSAPPPSASSPAPLEKPLPGSEAPAFVGEEEADPNTSVILDNADSLQTLSPNSHVFVARGNVRLHYKGYTLTCDRADVDTDTGEATFTGNALLKAPGGQTVQGGPDGVLHLNLRHDTYVVEHSRAIVPADTIGYGLLLPVFVYGGRITGRPGFIDAHGSEFTTCDFLEPHYSFGARDTYIIPGKRLVARDVTLYRKGHRIVSFPYFVVPLDRRFARQTLFPQVGETPDEGYFVKFALGYALASSLPGILHIDAMQRKGLGTGFEQNYGSTDNPRRGSGLFSLYHLNDRSTGADEITGSLNHTQQFGTVAATLTTQFQQNSYFTGLSRSQSQNSTLNLSRSVGNLTTSLTANLVKSQFGLGQSQTLTSSLENIFLPSSGQKLETRFDFSQTTSPALFGFGGSSQKQLTSNLDYTRRGKLVDFEMLATQYTQLSGPRTNGAYFGGVERLPEVRFGTDVLRAYGLKRLLPQTALLNLSLGEFNEPSSKTHTERARFTLDLGDITHKLTGRSTLEGGGSFQQGWYGDNTAQYILSGRTAYRLRIGSKSTANVSYTYLRPYGYTPFQFDFSGSSNLASLNVAEQESKAFQLTLGTGYDFNREHSEFGQSATPWQTIFAQSVYAPSDAFRLRTTASYDINHERLQDLTNTVRVRGSDLLALDVATRYAPSLHKFSNINGSINLPFFRDPTEDAGYRLQAIGGYNGLTSKFDYQGLALTRSWHDWEASLIYQNTPNGLRPGSQFTFNFRLKAFPAYEPFAVGQYGQSLDTGIGEVY